MLPGDQEGHALPAEFSEDVAKYLNIFGAQTQEGIVQQEDTSPGHKPPGQDHHALLTTAEIAGQGFLLLGQLREELIDKFQVLRDLGPFQVAANFQIFQDSHFRKDIGAFRDINHPPAHHLPDRQGGDIFAGYDDFAGNRAQQAPPLPLRWWSCRRRWDRPPRPPAAARPGG